MATKAYYQHHERTTDAALITDLQQRELGYSSESDYAIIKNNSGTARYIPTFSTTAIIESSGDIGIGISPSHPLDVYRASTNNIAKFKHAGSGGTIIVADGSADFYIGSQSGNGFLGGSTTGTAKVNINLTSGDMTVAGSIHSGFKIGAGRTPMTLLDIYHLTADAIGTFETDKVNGLAYTIFTNDNTSWSAGLNGSDEYIIVHSAGLVSNPALTIDTSEIITFANFPITPSSAPTTDYQATNKKYVDDNFGDVSKVGTPVNDQIAVWTGNGTIEGNANLTISSAGDFRVNGSIGSGRAPTTQLDVYHATNDVACTIETAKGDGAAYQVCTNDAGSWAFGQSSVDLFMIKNTYDLNAPVDAAIAIDTNNYVCLGNRIPITQLDVYNPANDVISTLETDKTNGYTCQVYTNDANSFSTGIDVNDNYVIADHYDLSANVRFTIDTNGDLTLAEDLIMAAGKSITMNQTVIFEASDVLTMDLLCGGSFVITGEHDRNVLHCSASSKNITISNSTDNGGAIVWGDVGIGTDSPSTLLHLYGEQSEYIKIERGTPGTKGVLLLGVTTSINQIISQGDPIGTDGKTLVFYTKESNGESVRIDTLGHVGIGATNPNAVVPLTISSPTNPGIQLIDTGGVDWAILLDGDDLIIKEGVLGSGPVDRLTLKSGGNILITNDLILPKTSGKGIKVDTTTPTFGWYDLLGHIETHGVGANEPQYNLYKDGIRQYEFNDVDDEVFLEFHLPHDYVPGSDIFIHAHWSHHDASTVTTGSLTWDFECNYASGYNQEAFNSAVTAQASHDASVTNIAQYFHQITEVQLSASSPSGAQLDSDDLEVDGLILVRVALSANSLGGGTNPFLHFVDIHYQSTNMPTKDKNTPFYT